MAQSDTEQAGTSSPGEMFSDDSQKGEKLAEEGGRSAEELCLVENGTVDYLGRRASKRTTGGPFIAPFTMGPELCERMGAFGVMFNLVPYLVHNLHLAQSYSANMVTNYGGTAYLTTLVGGYVADTWLGRFWTIVIFAGIYITGMTVFTLFSSLPEFRVAPCTILPNGASKCVAVHGSNLGILYIAIYLISLGTGGIKACVAGFGADQFDVHDQKEKKHMTHYFNGFFFFITTGAVLGVTFLVYTQDQIGRSWGFGIMVGLMSVAVLVLLLGRRKYRYTSPKGSPFNRVGRVLVVAWHKRRLALPSDPATMLYEKDFIFGEKIHHTNQFLFLSKAAIANIANSTITSIAPQEKSDKEEKETGVAKITTNVYSDRDEVKHKSNELISDITVTQAEEVKVIIRLLPILVTTVIFWTVYAQMTTFSVTQALAMDRKLGGFTMSAGNVTVMLQLSIVLMIIVYDRVVVPILRIFTRRPQGITYLQRIGFGLIFASIAMVAASLVERKRRDTALDSGSQISVFWLFPQFFLVGTGEALVYIGQLEFFYNESPASMRSMGTALSLCTVSIGFYTSSFLVDTIQRYTKSGSSKGWLADSLNEARLDRFYLMLSVLSGIDFLAYQVVARWYKYRYKLNDNMDDCMALH